jgi:hypothetical protein
MYVWGNAAGQLLEALQFPMLSLEFFIATLAQGSTQSLSECGNFSCEVKLAGV